MNLKQNNFHGTLSDFSGEKTYSFHVSNDSAVVSFYLCGDRLWQRYLTREGARSLYKFCLPSYPVKKVL